MQAVILSFLTVMLSQGEAQRTCSNVSLVVDPPELVVEFGRSVEINCSTTEAEFLSLYWRSANGSDQEAEGKFVTWRNNMSGLNPWSLCILKLTDKLECSIEVPITVYKNPDRVIMTNVYGGPLVEGTGLQLQCDIINVAPIQNLTVMWYHGNHTIQTESFSHVNKGQTPGTESSTLTINLTREHDGTQVRCETRLNLGIQPAAVSSKPYTIQVQYPPDFTNLSSRKSVEKGANVSLSCEAEGNPAPELMWSYDAEGHKHVVNQSILFVTEVTNSTMYSCTATNRLGSKTKQVYVHVEAADTTLTLAPPAMYGVTEADCPLELEPHTAVVRIGDRLLVNCSTSSTKALGIGLEATINSTGLKLNVTFVTWEVNKMNDWTIKPICFLALPDNEQCSRKMAVIVYKTPDHVVMSRFNHTGPMVEGGTYQLQCDVINVAPVQSLSVKWYRGKEVIHTRTFHDASRKMQTVSSLLSINTSRADDGVQFSCEAQLNLGPEGPLTPLTVMSSPYTSVVYFQPILAYPEHYEVRENDVHDLSRVTEGNPQPRVTWFRDGREVALPSRLTRQDSGKYTITATNELGASSQILYISVQYAPEMPEESLTMEVASGSDVSLGCSAEGNPSPDLQWIHSPAANIRQASGGRYVNIRITAATSTNSGNYTCVAKNELGSVSRSITLRMKTDHHYILYVCALLILLIILLALGLHFYHKRKHGQYNLDTVNTGEVSDIPMAALMHEYEA